MNDPIEQRHQAILFVMEFYNVDYYTASVLYSDEVDAAMRLIEKKVIQNESDE